MTRKELLSFLTKKKPVKPKVKKPCEWCETIFTAYHPKKQRFCRNKCRDNYHNYNKQNA